MFHTASQVNQTDGCAEVWWTVRMDTVYIDFEQVLHSQLLHAIKVFCPVCMFEPWMKNNINLSCVVLYLGMYWGQFLPSTGYRVIRRFFAESEYRVVDCLSKHAQHKLNGCLRKCTSYSDHRYLWPRLRLAIDIYKKP